MSLDRPTTVPELLNYRLARLLAATSAPGIRLLEGRYGIRRREWGLLGLIATFGPMSPSELAERASLERDKISLNIGPLIAAGLIERTAVSGDRRRARLDLTPAGSLLFDQVFPLLAELSEHVLRVLTREQLIALDEIITALTASAAKVNEQNPISEKADRRRGGSRRDRSSDFSSLQNARSLRP